MDQLKDVILSTLAEIQESVPEQEATKQPDIQKTANSADQNTKQTNESQQQPPKKSFYSDVTEKQTHIQEQSSLTATHSKESELLFLNSLRERLLVLFEGFQAPNNTALEAKIDLTLNFLEYLLSVIDERIENIKGK